MLWLPNDQVNVWRYLHLWSSPESAIDDTVSYTVSCYAWLKLLNPTCKNYGAAPSCSRACNFSDRLDMGTGCWKISNAWDSQPRQTRCTRSCGGWRSKATSPATGTLKNLDHANSIKHHPTESGLPKPCTKNGSNSQ